MNVTHLVGVHEAGVAHHVAAVGQVNRENGSAAMANGARAMPVQVFVIVRGDVAAGEIALNPRKKLGIDGHQVFVLAVDGAFLHHPDLTITLDDLRLNFADLFVDEVTPVLFAVQDRLTGFFNAVRTERIGLPRPAERRLRLLPRLQQRLIRPFRGEGRVRIVFVEELYGLEGYAGSLAERPIERLPEFGPNRLRHFPHLSHTVFGSWKRPAAAPAPGRTQ